MLAFAALLFLVVDYVHVLPLGVFKAWGDKEGQTLRDEVVGEEPVARWHNGVRLFLSKSALLPFSHT